MNVASEPSKRHQNLGLWVTVVIEGVMIVAGGLYNIYEVRRNSELVQAKIEGLAAFSAEQGEKLDRVTTVVETYVTQKLTAEVSGEATGRAASGQNALSRFYKRGVDLADGQPGLPTDVEVSVNEQNLRPRDDARWSAEQLSIIGIVEKHFGWEPGADGLYHVHDTGGLWFVMAYPVVERKPDGTPRSPGYKQVALNPDTDYFEVIKDTQYFQDGRLVSVIVTESEPR